MRAAAAAITLAVALCPVAAARATTYYVSASGRDSNGGTSSIAPFKTIKKAMLLTNPGDIVNVMDGTYPPFMISRSGSATGGYITYQAYTGQHPVITKGTAWDNIQLYSSSGGPSYIIISGFTVLGNAQSITADQANAAPANNTTTNGNCIGAGPTSHHVIVRNNDISYCPGGGIVMTGDYLYIYQNVIHQNSFWSPLDTSGVTVSGKDSDGYTGAKILLYDNILWGNQNFICNKPQTNPCRITDGEGIIVDSNKATGYHGRISIYNNIAYGNGGPGIEVLGSQHVDVFNNTTYVNNKSADEPSPYTGHASGGEILVSQSTDVNVANNILYGNPDVPLLYTGKTANTVFYWDYNLYFSGIGAKVDSAHDLVGDPLFQNGPGYDFHLLSGSPALNSGTSGFMPKDDFDGISRGTGSPSRGPYQD